MVVGAVNNDIPPGAMNTFSTVGDITGHCPVWQKRGNGMAGK